MQFTQIVNSFKRRIYKTIRPVGLFNESYSECGEDLIIDFLVKNKGTEIYSYLDLGAYSGINCNNTYKFYLKGAKGILVEADESAIRALKLDRPKDKILNLGVGLTESASQEFHLFDNRALNTFDKVEAQHRVNQGHKIIKTQIIKLVSINQIIEEFLDTTPDLLSIDIEGMDLDVLKMLDFEKYPIKIICVETCNYSKSHVKSKDNRFNELLIQKGYFNYADTYINTIYVNNNWFYNS